MMRIGMNTSHKYRHLLGVFIISVVGAIIYSNTLHSPFVFDDFRNITDNPYVSSTQLNLNRLYHLAFKSGSANRPVANISFAINYYFGGYDPTGYHIVNIILHLINGSLVYFLALIIFRQLPHVSSPARSALIPETPGYPVIWMSLFAALIFIAHPIQTQSVTYIVQRMNSLAAMFYLLSFLLYIQGRLAQRRWKRWALFSACLLSWVMGLGSKEIAATLPLLILLYEWYFFQDLSPAWLRKNIVRLAVPIAIFFLIALIYLKDHPFESILAGYTRRDFTVWERVLTQFRVVVYYISLLLYPHPSSLNLIHHVTTSHSLFDPITTFLAVLLAAGLIGLGVYLARRQRLISFCIFWFFITLVIESSVIALEMMYEHRLYLPMFGFALLVTYLLFHFLSKKPLWAPMLCVILISLLSTATYLRNQTWQDEITLWSDVVEKNPKSYRGHNNLANALPETRLDEAIAHYQEALRLKPDFAEAHISFGRVLKDTGNLDQAISHYYTALSISPKNVQAHINLAAALLLQGRLSEAISHSLQAVRLRPDYIDGYNNLGNALVRQGRLDEAIKVLEQGLQIKPDNVKAHSNMGVALMGKGRVDEAIDHFSEALRIQPDDAKVHSNLGVALVRQGHPDKAIRHFSEALRIQPDYEEARRNLEVARRLANGSAAGGSGPGVIP